MEESSANYSWVPFYEKMATALLSFAPHRNELVQKLRESFEKHKLKQPTWGPDGVEPSQIDPFTIFCSFSKFSMAQENRIKYAAAVAEVLGVDSPLPNGFNGLSLMNAMRAAFYGWEALENGADDIDNLWKLFVSAIQYADTGSPESEAEFVRVYDIAQTQYAIKWNITMGLFWIRPRTFINLDQVCRTFINNRLKLAIPPIKASVPPSGMEYLRVCNACTDYAKQKGALYSNIPEISSAAWLDFHKKEEENGIKYAGEHSDVSLNTILYGPPGTGKTFNTAAYAVAICEGRPVYEVLQENDETVKKRYDNYASQGRIAFTTFHQSYEYGDFIEGLAPVVKGGSIAYEVKAGVFREFCEQVPDEPCVFIIDEINRGNISKILGELITLIEESKRGKLSVKLPVSGEEFTVPRNVYILGTMNTADRSLAMMDTALRRRFDFVRMDPQPELLPADVDGVDVPMMLRTMNKRICWLYDAEHTLGHALFWGVRNDPTLENLGRIFRKKVIPLLMEYFHDDYAKVKQVLGNSSMMEEENLPADLFSRQEELDLLQSQYHPLPDADPRWEDAVTYTAIYM